MTDYSYYPQRTIGQVSRLSHLSEYKVLQELREIAESHFRWGSITRAEIDEIFNPQLKFYEKEIRQKLDELFSRRHIPFDKQPDYIQKAASAYQNAWKQKP